MDISHLYHDATFGDPTLELDVKEQLRTRIVNAREERHLEMLSKSYERAKFICEKNTAWERWKVGQSLHGINEKSPQLDRSLAREKARVEELQRSILMRNVRFRNKRLPQTTKPVSPVMRSVSSTTLEPLSPETRIRKRRRQRRKDKTSKGETDGLTQSITERHLQRPGDFARRTEHVVKSLAKLNWRQQTRRRDHEKFKEELKLHSKPVIEKARVILKGRSDIDVDTMMTDFENILLPPQTFEGSLNNSNYKNMKSSDVPAMLTKSNLLQLSDRRENGSCLRTLSDTSSLPPPSLETNILKCHSDSPVTSSDGVLQSTSTKSSPRADKIMDHADGKPNIDSETIAKKTDNNESVRPNQLPSLTPSTIQDTKSPPSGDTASFPRTPTSEMRNCSPPRSWARGNPTSSDSRKSNLTAVFSPSTSVSQVILEEEEDSENVKENNTSIGRETQQRSHPTFLDSNNNSVVDSKPTTSGYRNKAGENYTMSHTTGLPQLWKLSLKKKKEKVAPEVSAATIARKHRRKRNESERMW